jgi:PAS domain S-box-containing protein
MAGLVLAIIMAAILAGAMTVPEAIRTHIPILSGVGFNTAIAFVLAGMALLLSRQRRWLGRLVAVISAAVLLQYLFAWLPPDGVWRIVLNVDGRGSPWPGRMAPLSAFSLLCAGLALARLDRARTLPGQILLQAVPPLILTAAVGGILNRYLDGLLFAATLDRYAIMSPPTMMVLSVFVVGYVAAMLETTWFREFYSRREERQAMIIGLAGFAVALLLGGAASVAVLGRQMQETVADELSKTAQTQATIFPLVVSSALHGLHSRTDKLMSRTDLPALLRDLAGTEGAAWLERDDGSASLHTGRPPVTSQFRLRLKSAKPAWLIRDREWLLEMHFPAAQGQGSIVVQEPLPVLDSFFARTSADVTGGVESRLCERAGQENMACFPSPLAPGSVLVPIQRNHQHIPMWYALNGQSGVIVAPDYRGVLVVAAYTPVPELGLGLVRKIDAEKMYQPIRSAVWQAIVVMVFIALLAALLIYWRVRRVVRRAIETGRQLHGVLDALPVGVWVTDAAGNSILNNPAGARIWAREQWAGMSKCCGCNGWWHDTGKRIEPSDWALARAIEQGETSLDEIIEIESFDGGRRIISNSALPLRDEKGAITGAVTVNQDITERIRADEELHRSRNLLQAIVENVPIRVFWKDVELRYLGCNIVFSRDAGMSCPEEIHGKDDFQLAWRDRAEQYRADDREVMHSGIPKLGYEERQTTPDGKTIWLRTSKVPLRDGNGTVIGVLGIYDDITQSKHTMEALQESRKSLSEAQRIGRMGSWELNLKSGELDWSDEVFSIFEIEPERFGASYEAVLALIHPDDRDRVNEAYTESLKKRIPYEIVHRLLFSDGRIKHVRECCETIYDEDGNPLRSIGTVQDITEYTLAMEEIRRLEREFSSLADNLPDIVSRFDHDLRHIYVNPEIERSTGMPRESLLGKTYLELGVPDKVAKIWTNALHRVFFTGKPEMFEFEFTTKSGIVKNYHTRAVPECDASGKIETVLTIAHDISTLKSAETVLRESEERLHGITTNVPGMVFQCCRHAGDDELHFTYISNGARWLLDSDAAVLQQNVHIFVGLIAPEDKPSFHTSMLQSQVFMTLWNWEGRLIMKDGETRWINLRATPRRHGDGMCMWDGVAINITESKVSEEKLVQSKNMLRELSAHLEGVREEERKRIAREIHDELGQTLTALRMDVSLARLGFGESSPQLMARLQSMTQLVDRTIKTARHVTSSLRPGALDLGIVAALEWLVEEFIEYASIPCELVLGDGDIELNEFTATAVFRIIQESLTNIARHAGASQVEIIVTRSSDQLCFEVRDNGKGFDPGAVATRKSFGLVGIRERVAMMEGDFALDSKPGQGTRIRVCVPVA